MRFAFAVALAVLLVAVPAIAADPHPRRLVLYRDDVPSGFRLDRERSGLRSNASEILRHPELGPLFARAGRLTGYSIEFRRGSRFVASRADLVRQPRGARLLLTWYDREVRRAAVRGLERSRARVGAESWLFWHASTGLTIVAWRYRRVFAAVVGTDLTKDETLELARAQQRRIVRALSYD